MTTIDKDFIVDLKRGLAEQGAGFTDNQETSRIGVTSLTGPDKKMGNDMGDLSHSQNFAVKLADSDDESDQLEQFQTTYGEEVLVISEPVEDDD